MGVQAQEFHKSSGDMIHNYFLAGDKYRRIERVASTLSNFWTGGMTSISSLLDTNEKNIKCQNV
jgi:hypothetical protein